MKTISSSLTNFLLTNTTFSRADLITIVLPNGQVISALYGSNLTTLTYPSGLPATLTVSGTGYPWLLNDPTYPFSSSGGTSPTTLAMSPGQVITLSYASGLVSDGSNTFDANGEFGVPAAGSPGYLINGNFIPARNALIGGFANASGFLVAPPFYIGNNATIGPAPVGTTKLSLGSNGLLYAGHSGNWVMNIVPPTYSSSVYGAWERGPYANEASFRLSSGSMELKAYIPETVLYPGTSTPLMQSLNSLVGSKVVIQTLFWPMGNSPSSGFSMGTMQLMIGQIGSLKQAGRSHIICEVFDLTQVLNRPFPPHQIQTACRHSFCDAGCTLPINSFRSTPYGLDPSSTTLYLNFSIPARVNGASYVYGNFIIVSNVLYMCTAGGNAALSPPTFNQTRGNTTTDGGVTWTSMGSLLLNTPPGNQSFPLGYVIGNSGQNKGFKRGIKVQVISSGFLQIQLLWAMPFPISGGDTFYLFAGCDKTLATCENVYNNLIHFGGMPFVPNPEIAQ